MTHPPPEEQLIAGLQQWARYFETLAAGDKRARPLADRARVIASDALELFARAEGLIEDAA